MPGRRTRRALFRDIDEAARPAARDRPVRAQPARRHVRLGRRLLRPDRRESDGQRSGLGRASSATSSPIGTISTSISTAPASARRATASSASAASGCSTSCRSGRARSASTSISSMRRAPSSTTGPATTSSSPPTAPTAASAPAMRSISASTSRSGRTSSSGSARPRCSRPSPSPSSRPRQAGSGPHAYRFDDDRAGASTFIVEMAPDTWAGLGLDRMDQPQAIALCERIFAKYLGGHALMSNAAHLPGPAGLAAVPPDRLPALGPPQPDPARRRGAHRPFLDRLGHQARARGRDQAGRGAEPSRPRPRAGARRISGRAQPRGAQAPEQRAQLDRMVRDARALPPFRADPVRLFAAHPLAAGQPRESAAARQGLARRRRALVPVEGARPHRQRAGAADVRAVPAARDGARESRRRLADGDVFGAGRLPERFPPRPLWRAGAGRRRPPLHRDDLRLGGRADHPGLRRHVRARTCRGLAADRRFRPRPQQGQILPPARPFRAQGQHQGRLGRL